MDVKEMLLRRGRDRLERMPLFRSADRGKHSAMSVRRNIDRSDKALALVAVGLLWGDRAAAKCGNVDYSWGADALAKMHDYVVTMMLFVVYLTYAIGAIVALYAALQIYIKMNVGEEGILKEILMLTGAIMFLIGASIVFPAFFGYSL